MARAREAVAAYASALAAFNRAEPNDLGTQLDDHADGIEDALHRLAGLDALPAAYAFALRQLDHFVADLPGDRLWLATSNSRLFDLLVEAYRTSPSNDTAAVLATADLLLARRSEESRAAGAALADLYLQSWSDPHTLAHVEVEIGTHADDSAFVAGFALRLGEFDPQELAQREAERLNASLDNRFFGSTYYAYDGELQVVYENGVSQALRAFWQALGRRPLVPPLTRPPVSSPGKLANIVNDLYKGHLSPTRVASGTTAEAVRFEIATGELVGGRAHVIKAENAVRGLDNWLRANPDAPSLDRLIAQSLRDDLLDALGRSPW